MVENKYISTMQDLDEQKSESGNIMRILSNPKTRAKLFDTSKVNIYFCGFFYTKLKDFFIFISFKTRSHLFFPVLECFIDPNSRQNPIDLH